MKKCKKTISQKHSWVDAPEIVNVQVDGNYFDVKKCQFCGVYDDTSMQEKGE